MAYLHSKIPNFGIGWKTFKSNLYVSSFHVGFYIFMDIWFVVCMAILRSTHMNGGLLVYFSRFRMLHL
jgi:hypothetical protein